MLQNIFTLLLSIFIVGISYNAQTPQDFGKKIVKTLASPEFYGRGYVNNGSQKTANFIENKFKEYGLKSFDGKFQQYFNINVNTFPTVVDLSIDGKKMETGKDFIAETISGSSKGTYNLLWVDSTNFPAIIDEMKSMRIGSSTAFVFDKKGIKNKDTLDLFNDFKYYLSSIGPIVTLEDKKFTWSVGHQNAKNAIVSVLRTKISKLTKEITLNIENKFEENYTSSNVIGYVEGRCKKKYLVFSAHYDHLGMMGQNTYFPGANDNASGTAMMLYLANYFSTHKPKYNIVFMSFGAEEAGILGSKYYTENPLFPLEKIKFLTNLDLAGTGDEGIKVVNGTLHKKQFKKLAKINLKKEYLHKVHFRGPAANSDHYWFTQKGVPAFFIYTLGGIKAYHDVFDKSETLPLTEFTDYSKLLIEFLGKL